VLDDDGAVKMMTTFHIDRLIAHLLQEGDYYSSRGFLGEPDEAKYVKSLDESSPRVMKRIVSKKR